MSRRSVAFKRKAGQYLRKHGQQPSSEVVTRLATANPRAPRRAMYERWAKDAGAK